MPKLERRCMESWKRLLPDYKVMRWDESSFDVMGNPFTAAAYKARKYAFVADYVRLYALLRYGGVYLDTDVEIVKSLDGFLCYEAFGGFETESVMQTGVLGAAPENAVMQEFFNVYSSMSYETDENGNNKTLPNSHILAGLLKERGLKLNNSRQSIAGVEVFPQEYFCPIDQATREIRVTDNTYAIHYLSGSWFSWKERMVNRFKNLIGRTLGYGTITFIRKLAGKSS